MATNVQNQGTVLGSSRQAFGDGDGKNLQLNKQGAVLTASPMAAWAEMCRLGNTFVARTNTAIAPVAALPTTASHFSLYMPSAGTASAVIHAIGWTTIASAAAAFVGQLIAHVTTVSVASITGTAVLGPKSISGTAVATATPFAAVTTVNNGVWHPVGPSVNGGAATATISMGQWVDVGGSYIVKPGMSLDLAVFCSAAGSATCDISVVWSELVV